MANVSNKASDASHVIENAMDGQTESLPEAVHQLRSTGPENRYKSFVPGRAANTAKHYVDGCGYMWAVSVAIEQARQEIWILDWWLSPELYLRRPPSKNESYRLDRMLHAAAERGVKVNVMVYKEIEGVLTLNSSYTKHYLESLHKNIAVMRHPDHSPSAQVFVSEIFDALRHFYSKGNELNQMSTAGVDDIVLFWAHHEKLLLVDGKMAFMGGLDLCFGRWDTHQHSIADAHPNNLEDIVFPGQDYNNARIMDFQNVQNWQANKLDRNAEPRMGWSDISVCLVGPVVEDMKAHFVQRWNLIYHEKYSAIAGGRYKELTLATSMRADPGPANRWVMENPIKGLLSEVEKLTLFHHGSGFINNLHQHNLTPTPGSVSIQLVRSCTQWSHGIPTENSICNAYIDVIKNSKYFIYIENQFFITATGDKQRPVKNQIGAALVERITRAHHAGENYKVIVCMPSVPAFAGDLHQESSLGTRAIMDFQYKSICRGGQSIMEMVEKAGVPDAKKYIRFYNLRNYDRINTSIPGKSNSVEKTSYVADTVSACEMLDGPSLTTIPWISSDVDDKVKKMIPDLSTAEIDAYVSEELYIHSKVLIADDRTVIVGSANLNDRSQLGTHDSEIAVVIEDSALMASKMNGTEYQVARFAASLRRTLFRKHLGLLPVQDYTKAVNEFLPLGQGPHEDMYDWGSREDMLVEDPLSEAFQELWNKTASTNTEVFDNVFRPVPTNKVRNWKQYVDYYEKYFPMPAANGSNGPKETGMQYKYGHVFKANFPGGVDDLKAELTKVKGALVDMPLEFLCEVDRLAEFGIAYNDITDDIYT